MDSLQVKYKNLKAQTKKKLSNNRAESMKTGGGSANLENVNELQFGFKDVQISGLINHFDSDGIISYATNSVVQFESEVIHPIEVANVDNTSEKATVAAILTAPERGNALISRFAKPKTPKNVEADPELVSMRKRKIELEVELLELQIKNEKIKAKKDELELLKLRRDLGFEAQDEPDDI